MGYKHHNYLTKTHGYPPLAYAEMFTMAWPLRLVIAGFFIVQGLSFVFVFFLFLAFSSAIIFFVKQCFCFVQNVHYFY